MSYPSSSKNIFSSSAVVYPFKKRLLPFPEDLRILNNFPGDENRNIIRPQSFGLPAVTNYFNYYHYASGPMEMEIANIEFALEFARSSVSILLINCRGRTAEFHLDRFISGGRGRCIRYNNQYFTPYKFVIDSGCDTDIEWSIAINYAGFYLRSLIQAGIIFVHQDDCECAKCRNYIMHDLDEVSAYRPIENSWQSNEALDLRVKKTNENSENINMGDRAKNVDRKYKRKHTKVGRGELAPIFGVAGLAPFSHNSNSDIAFRNYWEAQARGRENQSNGFIESQNFATGSYPQVTSTRVESGLSNNMWLNNAGPIDATYKACEERRLAAFRAAQVQAQAQAQPMPSGSNMPFGQHPHPYGYMASPCPGPSTSNGAEVFQMHRIQAPPPVDSSAKRRRMNPIETPSTRQVFRPAPIIEPRLANFCGTQVPSTSGMSVQITEQLNGRNWDLARFSGFSNNYPTHGCNSLCPLDQNIFRDTAVMERDPGPSVAPQFVPPQTAQIDESMPGPENLGVENITEIIPTATPGIYLFRHADNTLHEYKLIPEPTTRAIEDSVRSFFVSNASPEIYITPPIEEGPASTEEYEQIVGEYMEIDDEVD